jgi:phosphate:Na+ symporter
LALYQGGKMIPEIVKMIFLAAGGLTFLFFGVICLSEGLQKASTARFKRVLEVFTKKPYQGLIFGSLVTCLLQSSSVVTSNLVVFANAGLMRLRQTIGMVLGANVGTTFTAWLVSAIAVLALFKITHYILPAIAVGFLIMRLSKEPKWQEGYGKAIFGFGLLLLGLSFLKDVSEPLKVMGVFERWFLIPSPFLAIPIGMVACWILQSSSATIALVQFLAFQGMIPLPVALGLALGADMGTPLTAEIAALIGNKTARQTARSHTVFNFLGPVYMIPLIGFGVYPQLIENLIPGPITQANIALHIALAHSIYNVFNALLFLPLVGVLEKISILATNFTDRIGSSLAKIFGKEWPKKEIEIEYLTLEEKLFLTPSLALEQTSRGMIQMASLAKEAIKNSMEALFKRKISLLSEIKEKENAIDLLQYKLTQYLSGLIQYSPDARTAKKIPSFIHSINDIEKLGDYAENLAHFTQKAIDENIRFPNEVLGELRQMYKEADKMMEEIIDSMRKNDKALARSVLEREKKLNQFKIDLREKNIQRMNNQTYSAEAGILIFDMINNFEKIGDHLENIAQGILETKENQNQTH